MCLKQIEENKFSAEKQTIEQYCNSISNIINIRNIRKVIIRLCPHRVFENILFDINQLFWISDISIDNNGERKVSVSSRERGPPPRKKQFQERWEWSHSLSCLLPEYPLNDSDSESISAANLPAVLREVEGNEREQPSAEDIRLWLCNSGLMQLKITSEKRGVSPLA